MHSFNIKYQTPTISNTDHFCQKILFTTLCLLSTTRHHTGSSTFKI